MTTARRWRPALALGLLAGGTVAALAAALLGGDVVGSPVDTLVVAVAAALVGAGWRGRVTVAACGAGAVLLTVASQVTHPRDYTAGNDLFFFAVLLGGPALAGAVLAAWSDQAVELRRLTGLRAAQREAELRTVALDERNRVETAVTRAMLQHLGGLVVQVSGARATTAAGDLPTAVHRLETGARAALEDLRAAVGSLRSPDPEVPVPPEDAPPPANRSHLRPVDVLVAASGVPVAVEAVLSASSRGPVLADVLAGLAVGAPLLVRRTHPLATGVACLGVATAMSAWLTPVGPLVSTLLPLSLLTYALGAHTRGRRRVPAALLLVVGLLATTVVGPAADRDTGGLLPTLVWVAVAFTAGVAAAGRNDRVVRLRRLLRRIESGADAQRRLVVAEQRQAVARDLHDTVAHAMTVVCLHAEAAQRHDQDGPLVQAALRTIEEATRDAMTRLRDGLAGMEVDEDLLARLQGVAGALGVPLHLDTADLDRALGPDEEQLAGRVVREALVNAARHAPGAAVRVRLAAGAGRLLVEATNDRVAGTAYAAGSGTGLLGLGELVRSHGGRLDHGPAGDRFRVVATLPRTPVAS